MAGQIVECVPNFSEGRDKKKVEAIERAIRATGVTVLRCEMDTDHNRSVITFAGAPDAVAQAALRAIEKAAELIDLREHAGVHPRIGATDVAPFVPIDGITLEECAALAWQTGEQVWRLLGIPVYFYEAAARRPERRHLENIRRGQFEKLRAEALSDPDRAPDLGGPAFHPSAGAVVMGARKLLIAWNINLDTQDLDIARRIARKIRASSGGLRHVKALGLPLASRNLVQVSMNLTDFQVTPPHVVFEVVKREAEAAGVRIASSELIGLIPKKAIEMAAGHWLEIEDFDSRRVLENRLAEARPGGELSPFIERVAAPLSPEGGGSAAAGSAAIAAALGSKIARLSRLDHSFREEMTWFSGAIARDAQAFQKVLMAEKGGDRRARQEALAGAAAIPLEIAERAHALAAVLEELAPQVPVRFVSDLRAAVSLARAAVEAAVATASANVAAMDDDAARAELKSRVEQAFSPAKLE